MFYHVPALMVANGQARLVWREREPSGAVSPVAGRIRDEGELAALAGALGASTVPCPSSGEALPPDAGGDVPPGLVAAAREGIRNGLDPLGEAFCLIRSPARRREDGAVYTPSAIVEAMLSWAESIGAPDRVIDPGSGSGRFLVEAGRRFPHARLVAIERDPLAALTARANLAATGMADRAEVRVENFLASELDGFAGRTLFVGNPPYVRHHQVPAKWKAWLKTRAREMGLDASALAGLHVYFFLAIASRAREGDYGGLVTASEWLDVNYGQLVRDLFLGRLGGRAIHMIEPEAEPFPGTATTGAITTFAINEQPPAARFARVGELSRLGKLEGGRPVGRERLRTARRWSHFTRTTVDVPHGYIELGELCRVHRGQSTGANRIWIAGEHSAGLPDDVLLPTVTRARELIRAGPVLDDAASLRRVIDLPEDLSGLDEKTRGAVENFLALAEQMGGKSCYTARQRSAWWSVRLRAPAPVLATYMARRPPAFVLNKVGARHLNIAHGLYPRGELADGVLAALVAYLRRSASTEGGRVYAGGLTKFEPREMERIPVPEPALLLEMAP